MLHRTSIVEQAQSQEPRLAGTRRASSASVQLSAMSDPVREGPVILFPIRVEEVQSGWRRAEGQAARDESRLLKHTPLPRARRGWEAGSLAAAATTWRGTRAALPTTPRRAEP